MNKFEVGDIVKVPEYDIKKGTIQDIDYSKEHEIYDYKVENEWYSEEWIEEYLEEV